MRRIENDATKYKQMLQRNKQTNVKPSQRKPQILAGGDSSITQIKSNEAKGDYKAWRKKAIAAALKRKKSFIKKGIPKQQ